MDTNHRSDPEIEAIRRSASLARKVVFVSGNFNIVHPGHVRLLRFASECGDFLVVGVSAQGTPGTMLSEDDRLEAVRSISVVDHALILRESPEAFIARLRPDVVVKGKEHESRKNAEQAAVDAYGGKLLFGSGESIYSSLDLIHHELRDIPVSSIRKPVDFLKRHGFSFDELRATVSRFKGARVLVVGDLIVDEYINCQPLGMSQEDPTIVVSPVSSERFIGGAGIVAAHASGLGAEVTYFTVAGDDATAVFAQEKLTDYGVRAEILSDESRPTTLKQRFRAGGKTMLRVSHLRQHDISHEVSDRMMTAIRARIPHTDLLIFSDFNYGCLPQVLVDGIIEDCLRHGVMMVADSQSSSQVGDVSRFKHMCLLTPTEREARLAVRDFNSGLVVLAEALREKSHARNIVITLGADGLMANAAMEGGTELFTDQLPAFNLAPKDTAGAGDSFLTCSSLALATGADLWQSIYLGSVAAACQVARVGNIPLEASDVVLELSDRRLSRER